MIKPDQAASFLWIVDFRSFCWKRQTAFPRASPRVQRFSWGSFLWKDCDTAPAGADDYEPPFPWTIIDGEDGAFYFNDETGESQWDPPGVG